MHVQTLRNADTVSASNVPKTTFMAVQCMDYVFAGYEARRL